MKSPFQRTCKEAALLITTQEDRRLNLGDRLALRLHLAACRTCPVFERQVQLMSQAMGRWRHYADRDE